MALRKKIVCFVLLVMVVIFQLSGCDFEIPEVYMFADISECSNIGNLEYEGGTLTEYDTPNGDKYLKKLQYNDFFAAKYESDKVDFKIFAYQFDNSETAQKYFINATGKDVDLETNFSASTGLFEYRLIVIDGVYAYTVFAPSSKYDEIEEVLSIVFTQKLDFSNKNKQ